MKMCGIIPACVLDVASSGVGLAISERRNV